MTAATFCTPGQSERVKGGVHAMAGTVVAVMAVYNAVAWWYRRERHLGVNAMIYAAGFAFEVYQTSRHFYRPGAAPEARINPPARAVADACECGDGFCWCGGAETRVVGLAAAAPDR